MYWLLHRRQHRLMDWLLQLHSCNTLQIMQLRWTDWLLQVVLLLLLWLAQVVLLLLQLLLLWF